MSSEFEDNLYTGTGVRFWKPTDVGDSIQGVLTAIEASQYKDDGKIYVLKTDDGDIRLPERKAMIGNLEKLGAEIGDTIFIKLTGWSSKKYYGKSIALYGVAVKKASGEFVDPKKVKRFNPEEKKAAEANMVTDEEEPEEEEKPKKKKKKEEEAPKPAPKVEEPKPAKVEAPKAAEPAPSADKITELKKFVSQIIKFEPEMPLENFNGYINTTRKYNIDPLVAAELCGLVVENGVVKSPTK